MKHSLRFSQDFSVTACDIMDVISIWQNVKTESNGSTKELFLIALRELREYYLDVLQLKTMI